MTRRPIPVACDLDPDDYGDRCNQWRELIARALKEKRETVSGLRLIFGAEVEADLERLAAAERQCCGFATWIVTRHQEDEVVLDVQAEGLGVAALHSMFE